MICIWAVVALAPGVVQASALPVMNTPLTPALLHYSFQGSYDLLGFPTDPGTIERELERLATRIRPLLAEATTGPQVVSAFHRVLIVEEGFRYDAAAGNPENYLLGAVLARKRGNCLGLSSVYLALAERLDVPFRGVYVPAHCFVRYERAGERVNVEFADGGAAWQDERYLREFRLAPGRPYLRSLSSGEMIGVFLKSLGAAYSKVGREADALRIYAEAERLFPGLPDAPYNAGVSLQKTGRVEEAIGKYRRALALDPDMVAARDNLGILLAQKGEYAEAIAEARRAVELEPRNAASLGNLASAYCACGRYEEGIREFRRALEIDPLSAPARAGLVRAHYARGDYREAARECGPAEAMGCRFEPSMLEALRPYR